MGGGAVRRLHTSSASGLQVLFCFYRIIKQPIALQATNDRSS